MFDIDAPHKLSWDEDVHVTNEAVSLDVAGDEVPALPKGACILYIFPTIMTEDEPGGSQPSEAGLRALRKLILKVATETAETRNDQRIVATSRGVGFWRRSSWSPRTSRQTPRS